MLSPSGTKRKRLDVNGDKDDDTLLGERVKTPKRKASSDFLRKGQWTMTEEKFAGALIDAFEEGYLPINMGVRLRGYLAVQLQCDPMRVSKKLCGGSIDGKKVPKNYGQKKFKSRRKQLWDQDEADRTIAMLEKLMHDLWQESGTPKPAFLTLSSTRDSVGEECINPTTTDKELTPSSPEIKQEDATAASLPSTVKSEPGTSLPIIYLNLSKKLKGNGASSTGSSSSSSSSDLKSHSKAGLDDAASPSTSSNVETSASGAKGGEAWNVDGDSLQAAYELLKLFQA
uniref:Uncharacterized protein n=1 Tax=Globisporangium ultimum (strain ATCC 200006 / CBS 805.95 / DAOM BR144) TaxID=431595 RepID=K3W6B4_GLOUD